MSEADFLTLAGPVLRHVTPASNLAGIARLGILRVVSMAEEAEVDPASLALRSAQVELRLGRERARIAGREALLTAGSDFLDGHSTESWARQLDRRLFLWPGDAAGIERAEAHAKSIAPSVTVEVDALRLYRAFGAQIDLAPINTAAAVIRPALRGDWIYTPATEAGLFPGARMARGLVKAPDRVAEISLRGDLTLPRLALVLASPLPKPA